MSGATFVSIALAVYWRSMPAGYEFHLHPLCIKSALLSLSLLNFNSSPFLHLPRPLRNILIQTSRTLRSSEPHPITFNPSTPRYPQSSTFITQLTLDSRLPTPDSRILSSVFSVQFELVRLPAAIITTLDCTRTRNYQTRVAIVCLPTLSSLLHPLTSIQTLTPTPTLEMSAEPNHEEINRKEATQADTAVPEISVPGSDECSMDSSSDSMTTGTADSTSLATTSLVDSEKMCNGIMGIVQAFKADISRLEMENNKLLESCRC